MKRFVLFVPVLLLVLTSLAAGQSRTYTIDDLLKARRVGDPQISPDGRRLAFTIGDVNFTANRVVNQIYVTSIDGGDELKRLTSGESSSSGPGSRARLSRRLTMVGSSTHSPPAIRRSASLRTPASPTRSLSR